MLNDLPWLLLDSPAPPLGPPHCHHSHGFPPPPSPSPPVPCSFLSPPLGVNLALLRGPLSDSIASSGMTLSLAGPFSCAAPSSGHLPFPSASPKVFLHFQALHLIRVVEEIDRPLINSPKCTLMDVD